jgi:hypothetical protein
VTGQKPKRDLTDDARWRGWCQHRRMGLDAYDANMAAEAAASSLRQSAAADQVGPAALPLAVAGAGHALLALAIGVNRLAGEVERFTGQPATPGIDDMIGAIDRLAEAIDRLGS